MEDDDSHDIDSYTGEALIKAADTDGHGRISYKVKLSPLTLR